MATRAAPPTTKTKTKTPTAAAAAVSATNEPLSETYEERQRRYNAARVLESNEMLIWWSTVRNEVSLRLPFSSHCPQWAPPMPTKLTISRAPRASSQSIPQTRLHFENQLAGFASDDSEPEWDDDPSGGPPPAGTPGVRVRFLFGENNKQRGGGANSTVVEQGLQQHAGGGEPDMVPLGGERVERRRPGCGTADVLEAARVRAQAVASAGAGAQGAAGGSGSGSARRGRRSASGSGSGSGSGNNSPAGKGAGKKGRRSMGGGGGGGGGEGAAAA
ncbi:hypothetical protein BC567DRAFT_213735 [Phyllosticta citribraziliensis]